MKVKSWKQELDAKYKHLTSMGDIKVIDKANEIILEAIAKLAVVIDRSRGCKE